jgi:predicted DNA-binding ribbon-helix-helix protein
MNSAVIKRSVVVTGHKTSVSLEDAFWKELKKIAARRDMTISELIGTIDSARQHANLSSAIRLFVLHFFVARLSGVEERSDGARETSTEPLAAVR